MKHICVWTAFVVCLLLPVPALATALYNVHCSPAGPALLEHGQRVTVAFDYQTELSGGLRVYVRPYANGALAPHYGAHPATLLPGGSGSGSGWFTITSGEVTVDDVRIHVYDYDQTELLLEIHVAAAYEFGQNAALYGEHAIYDVALSPATPSWMRRGEAIEASFSYRTSYAAGVRVRLHLYDNGQAVTPTSGSTSALLPMGTGTGSASMAVEASDRHVDEIRLVMEKADTMDEMVSLSIPADYQIDVAATHDLQFIPASPNGRRNGEQVVINFEYQVYEPGGVRIYMMPYTDGSPTPNFSISSSPIYTGSGTGQNIFVIANGDAVVDQLYCWTTGAYSSDVLSEYFVPINYYFGRHVVRDPQLRVPSRAYFTTGHRDTLDLDYYTSEVSGVRITARPFSGGSSTPGGFYVGTGLLATGSGSASCFIGCNVDALIDGLQIKMTDASGAVTLMEWLLPVSLIYGNMEPALVWDVAAQPQRSGLHLAVGPNPAQIGFSVRYRLPAAAEVELRLFDLQGREVHRVLEETQAAGEQHLAFGAAGLASGVYFCRLEARSTLDPRQASVETVRLVVTR
ncbi:MAG: T9SS type A sorting domain-containing protein [Candidatus Eisenbacteria sp.]|nr:T9SS type A sorting domain-containing protein [Candidatus Eisenbacteria bacterium]